MQFTPEWSSHYPVLIKVMEQAYGPVLEMGMGPFSTPLLHWLCFDKGLTLDSFDNDPKYFDLNMKFDSEFHKVRFVNDWEDLFLNKIYSVAFIDHKPARRRHKDIAHLANKADFVIIHDSEPEQDKYYGYSRIYKYFKYRFDYTKARPFTTVLSNVNDLSFLKNE